MEEEHIAHPPLPTETTRVTFKPAPKEGEISLDGRAEHDVPINAVDFKIWEIYEPDDATIRIKHRKVCTDYECLRTHDSYTIISMKQLKNPEVKRGLLNRYFNYIHEKSHKEIEEINDAAKDAVNKVLRQKNEKQRIISDQLHSLD